MGGPGAWYATEFKAEAVTQVIERDYSVREVAERIGVSEYNLYQWVKRTRQRAEQWSSSGDLIIENARLKVELKRVVLCTPCRGIPGFKKHVRGIQPRTIPHRLRERSAKPRLSSLSEFPAAGATRQSGPSQHYPLRRS